MYHIVHRPGKDNHLPDYLSRAENFPIDVEVQDESLFEDKYLVWRLLKMYQPLSA